MQNQVIADIEIEDQKIAYYSSVIISQKFNEHHTFSIRIEYDVLEKAGTFSLSHAQKLIGKSAIIKLLDANTKKVAYEFHGLVCEINVEQSENFTSDLVIKGYSPTILLENGPDFNSFHDKNLQQIAGTLTQSLSQVSCSVSNNPQFKSPITYICQYRESAFHFLNRLSSNFGEWFYYDGQKLYFGRPSKSPEISVTYGVDIQNLQIKLRILPLTFGAYSYVSKNDSFVSSKAPSSVDGLDEYASYALNESKKIFSEAVNFPVNQRVGSKSDLDNFIKQQKTAMAANLKVLSAISDNPTVCIGSVADVKVTVLDNTKFKTEDGGKFLITSVEHHVTANGKYYNSFEGIPSGIEVIPVTNVSTPIAEPQIATVTDNADPANMGRICVQMLWQKQSGETTDWLRVLTPDAGSSSEVSKNRGFVFIPEVGDQVLLCFRYNDPDRPFVLGSIFHGSTAAGGGSNNDKKTLSTKSGHTIEMNDTSGAEKITITDKKKNVIIIDTVQDSINITANTLVNIKAPTINMDATDIIMTAKNSVSTTAGGTISESAGAAISETAGAAITMNAGGALEGAAGGVVTFGAGASASLVSAMDTVIMAGKMFSASAGKNVKISSGVGASINLEATGNAKFDSSKKMVISSKESTISGSDKALFTSKEATMEGSSKAVVKGSEVDIS